MQVSREDVEKLVRRYHISNSLELSAVQLSSLPRLETMFVHLAQQMNSIREEMEVTKSAARLREGVITLPEDDWEIITAPEEPVPHYAYRAQESGRRHRPSSCRC